MTDRLTPKQRHAAMAAIHGKDTKPEMIVRRFLWHRGYRYRLNHKYLRGKPDVVLHKYRTCIFVNGCFWHGHDDCPLYTVPKTNTDFWLQKVRRNKERDAKVLRQVEEMGWHSITIWECQLRPDRREATLQYLDYTLNILFLRDHQKVRPYGTEESPATYAAEAEPQETL